ncbi:MAG: hypothetical protein HOP29_06265, partial [Phycisphaerales bacterium]|nr:hypothetical protein [Phycisphaerales bacterium]
MNQLDSKIRQARARLTLNRWLGLGCVCMTAAAGVYLGLVVTARGFGWAWPLGWIALGLVGGALV